MINFWVSKMIKYLTLFLISTQALANPIDDYNAEKRQLNRDIREHKDLFKKSETVADFVEELERIKRDKRDVENKEVVTLSLIHI